MPMAASPQGTAGEAQCIEEDDSIGHGNECIGRTSRRLHQVQGVWLSLRMKSELKAHGVSGCWRGAQKVV